MAALWKTLCSPDMTPAFWQADGAAAHGIEAQL